MVLATVSACLRSASKDSSPPDQNHTRVNEALRSACASKSYQTTTDGAQPLPYCGMITAKNK
ncbi:hypothetical protein SFRURICE_005674 [Spodoptera frugiperda]|nr:hypothetical protein SFRURICE_005674 [Spodoptera frugiperda]